MGLSPTNRPGADLMAATAYGPEQRPNGDTGPPYTWWNPKIPPNVHPSSIYPDNPIHPPSTEKHTSWHTITITPPESPITLGMNLNCPTFGIVLMTPPEDAKIHAQVRGGEPSFDHALSGSFEITLPLGVKRIRYKSIEVGVGCVAHWRGKSERAGQVDVLFHRVLTTGEKREEGNILHSGERIDFTLFLPSSMPLQDWHKFLVIQDTLYATIHGEPIPGSETGSGTYIDSLTRLRAVEDRIPPRNLKNEPTFNNFLPGQGSIGNRLGSLIPRGASSLISLGKKTSSDQASSQAQRSAKNSMDKRSMTSSGMDRSITSTPTLSSTQSRGSSHQSLNSQTGSDDDPNNIPWLIGDHTAERALRVVHNPNPDDGTNTLNEHYKGSIDGLGTYEIRCWSDIWTIATLMKATFVVVDLPPETTIFYFKVSIVQKHHITVTATVPSNDRKQYKDVETTYKLLIAEEGSPVPKQHQFPGTDIPALWRGTHAGGKDEDILFLESVGRLPTDSNLRMTTPPSTHTPMRVSHEFEIDVYFSVKGKDSAGKPVRGGGAGELRVMRIKRNVVVPSCGLMPAVVKLPDYEHPEEVKLGQNSRNPRRPWDACACYLTYNEVLERMNEATKMEEKERDERDHAAARKAVEEARARAEALRQSAGSSSGPSFTSPAE